MGRDMQADDRVRLTLEGVVDRADVLGAHIVLDSSGEKYGATFFAIEELQASTAKVEILTLDREAAHARAIQSLMNLKAGAEIALAISPNGPVFDFLKAIEREVAKGLGEGE